MPQKPAKTGICVSGFLLTALLILVSGADVAAALVSRSSDETESASAQSSQRYLSALVRNPRPGTAFEKVYAWHADRGSAGRFRHSLLQYAIQAGAVDSNTLPDAGASSAAADSPGDSAQILPLPPGSAGDAALVLAALIDLRHGEPQSAAVLLTRAAELRPKDPTTRWMLARALDQSEQGVAAAAAFETALSLRPARVDLAEIHRDYAESLQRQRKPDDALQVWQRLEQAFPGDRRVLRQVARALSRDGRWTDALKRYEQLAATADEAEERITAELEVCDALQQLERRPEALTRLQTLLPELDPNAWLYRDVRARIEQLHRATDDLTGLTQYYTTWLSSHPEDLDVMQRLARVLQELGRGEEARHWLTQALDRAPENTALRNAFIAALQSAGRTAEAAVRLQEWLDAGPAAPAQWQQLGLLQLARTDLALPARQELAAAAFERFVTLVDKDPRQLRQAAELLERAGQFARAEELLRTGLAASPDDAVAREALGLFLHRRQRSSEALEVWNLLAAGSRKTPESLGQLADLLQRNGFVPQAVAARREACELSPGLNDRLRFVELLLVAAEAGAAAAQDHFTEALEQLDLADRSAAEATERERVLELRVRVLLASDGLTQALFSERQRISQQSAAAASTVTAADYRRLCALETAAGQISAAAAACLEVVQREPASIADWSLLVQLCERSGQTGEAAAALQKLMQLDRRGWSGYQQQLVRLELRQGRPEAALAAATELTRATPGSVEAWQFLAETAFAAGQPAQGVEALRRAVRASPGDVTALRSLARTLADEFQTAEALELSWRAFEQSADGQERQELAAFLAQLALRSGRWTGTHERLEQWLRIQPDALDAARAAAAFFREAGRFSEARAVLEPLLHADPENSTLLTEIANLAERERRADLAFDYLLRLYRSTGSLQDLRRLLLLEPAALQHAGFAAHQLLAEAATAAVSRSDFHAVIQLGLSRQLQSAALQLCLERLQRDPDDWWSLHQAARLAADSSADNTTTQTPQELRLQLLNLPLSPGSTAAVSQPVNVAQPITPPQPTTTPPTTPEVQRIWRQAAAATPDSDNGATIFAESLVLAARHQLRAEGSAGLQRLLESNAVRLHGPEFLQACVAMP
ncbi:MAG: tetratricopeptide repeat protein, partial [Planctomycetaceae bacterium]